MTTITGILEDKDNKFRLGPITKSYQNEFRNHTPTRTLPPNKYLIGMVNVNELLKLLAINGFDGAVVANQTNQNQYRIEIVSVFPNNLIIDTHTITML